MEWQQVERIAVRMPLAPGYRFEPLRRAEIGALIAFIATWSSASTRRSTPRCWWKRPASRSPSPTT